MSLSVEAQSPLRWRVLLGAVARRHLIELRRYAFETVMLVVGLYVLFMLVFLGAKAALPTSSENATLPAVVTGFFVWSLAMLAYADISSQLQQEAVAGTLEQLAMAPYGLLRVLLSGFMVSSVTYVLIDLAMLLLMMATTGQWLTIDVVVVPLMFLSVGSVLGLGLVIGGFALLFKRVQSFVGLVQLALLGVVALPLDRAEWAAFLPLALGSHLIDEVMTSGRSPSAPLVGLLGIHALLWVGVGAATFSWFERRARQAGVLGHF